MIWAGSPLRNISVVSKQEYLQSQQSYFFKSYTSDFLPQQAGRCHLFTKYDFKVTSDDTQFNIRINCPGDKYLLDFMRVKIIDKSASLIQATKHTTFNAVNLKNIQLPPTDAGYCILIEGVMPYNTTEGQLVLEVMSNKEDFELREVIGCEPLEYTDNYQASKYGIIFKEKIHISPIEHT